MTNFAPPRRAEFFGAALIADPELRDAVLGDLAEEYARVAQAETPKSANAWYWSQLVRSAIPFSAMAVARGGWVGWARLVFATLLSYAFFNQFYGRAVVWLSHRSWSPSPGAWPFILAILACIVFSAAVAGFVAALVAGRSPLAAALALGALAAMLSAYPLVGVFFKLGAFSHAGPLPAWYAFAGISRLLLVCSGFVAGGLVRGGALVRLRAR